MEEPKVHHERIGKCNRLNFAGASSAVYKQGGGVTSGWPRTCHHFAKLAKWHLPRWYSTTSQTIVLADKSTPMTKRLDNHLCKKTCYIHSCYFMDHKPFSSKYWWNCETIFFSGESRWKRRRLEKKTKNFSFAYGILIPNLKLAKHTASHGMFTH